jgi:hypothetical protein
MAVRIMLENVATMFRRRAGVHEPVVLRAGQTRSDAVVAGVEETEQAVGCQPERDHDQQQHP